MIHRHADGHTHTHSQQCSTQSLAPVGVADKYNGLT